MAPPLIQRLNLDRPRLPRNRKIQACQQCRVRKTKCDQGKPRCQGCLARNQACTYASKAQKSNQPLPTSPAIKGRVVGPVQSSTCFPDATSVLQGDQTIWPNQSDHLATTNDTPARYYSSSSWVSALDRFEHPLRQPPPKTISGLGLTGTSQAVQSQGAPSPQSVEVPPFVHLEEVDRLLRWYSEFCQFWYPVVDIPEITASVEKLRNGASSSVDSLALIAAVCFTATSSLNASGDISQSNYAPSVWKEMAQRLLSASGYPCRPNMITVQAAFLLAIPSMAEWKAHPDPGPICILIRASQSLGLHRDPTSFQLSPREADFSRVLWWSIHGLDVGYALAHAVPTLIAPTKFDVQINLGEDKLYRRFLTSLIPTNLILSRIFEEIYGVRPPKRHVFQKLDEEVEKLCTCHAMDYQPPYALPLEKFIKLGQRLCCWKVAFVLHQPYLRSSQWPKISRRKALDACQNYISDFSSAVTDCSLTSYRWVLDHFNVFHACAVILQDLIQYPQSAESPLLLNVIMTAFSTFATESDPHWEKLESLRLKAWAATKLPSVEQEDISVDVQDVDSSLLDWDQLFASFIWDSMQ